MLFVQTCNIIIFTPEYPGWTCRHCIHTKLPFFNLREDIEEYLGSNPSKTELKYLMATIEELVTVDGKATASEIVVLSELEGLFERISGKSPVDTYSVAIVPQSIEQDFYLASTMTGLSRKKLQGGQAFVTSSFCSKDFAEKVMAQFQDHGYFTTVVAGT